MEKQIIVRKQFCNQFSCACETKHILTFFREMEDMGVKKVVYEDLCQECGHHQFETISKKGWEALKCK